MITKRVKWLFSLVYLWPHTANACAVCYGATESKLVHGSTVGAVFLVSLTALVLSFFGYLIFYIRKKSNLNNNLKINGKRIS
jgi:hypothetical protein